MLAAQVDKWADGPKLTSVTLPPEPVDENTKQIHVLASGLHNVVRARASGQHSSVTNLPHIPGIDGIGVDVLSGKNVYFSMPVSPSGAFAEYVNVPAPHVLEIPEGVKPSHAAVLVNPLCSSWMSLKKRINLHNYEHQSGWTCFIMGVGSFSGQLAIGVARRLGATRVIGAARNESDLKDLELDDYVVLKHPPSATDFTLAAESDVVLDYLYGPYVEPYLRGTQTTAKSVTYISIGSVAGVSASIPSALLRSKDITIRGSGPGSWPMQDLGTELPNILDLLSDEYFVKVAEEAQIRSFMLEDFDKGWEFSGKQRVVFVTDKTLLLQ